MRPDASDTSRRPADLGFDHVGVGHSNTWICDYCKRTSGIFAGRKKTRRGWACAGCIRSAAKGSQ